MNDPLDPRKALLAGFLTLAAGLAPAHAEKPDIPAEISPQAAPPTQPAKLPDPRPGEVVVARLIFGDGWRDDCFSDAFLGEVGRESRIKIYRHLPLVPLNDPEKLREHPLAILSGAWAFTLTDDEKKALRQYLTRGGFLLGSAHCGNPGFDRSFRQAIAQVLPEAKWVRLKPKHKVFHTLFEIDKLRTKQATQEEPALEGLLLDDKLVCLYAPIGLADTDSLPSNCCCCGSNELRDARKINANIVAYVLTH